MWDTEVATRTLQTSGQHLDLRPGGRHRPPRAQIKRQPLTASPPRPGTRNQLECPARGPAPALGREAGQCAKRQRAHTGQRPVRSGTEGVRRSPARPRKRLSGGWLHLMLRRVVAPQPENPEPTHGHTLLRPVALPREPRLGPRGRHTWCDVTHSAGRHRLPSHPLHALHFSEPGTG